jgi:hypothetical protein
LPAKFVGTTVEQKTSKGENPVDEERVQEHKEEQPEEPDVQGHRVVEDPDVVEEPDVQGHRVVEDPDVVEEPDVEGHVLERPEHTEMKE